MRIFLEFLQWLEHRPQLELRTQAREVGVEFHEVLRRGWLRPDGYLAHIRVPFLDGEEEVEVEIDEAAGCFLYASPQRRSLRIARPLSEIALYRLSMDTTTGAAYLNCDFVVLEGPYAKRKVWSLIGLHSEKGPEWANMGRSFIRALLNSARGLHPRDDSPAAQSARCIQGFANLDGIEFVARIDVEKDQRSVEDRNVIHTVIQPDYPEYAAVMGGVRVPASAVTAAPAAPAPFAAPAAPAAAAGPAQPFRPAWAE